MWWVLVVVKILLAIYSLTFIIITQYGSSYSIRKQQLGICRSDRFIADFIYFRSQVCSTILWNLSITGNTKRLGQLFYIFSVDTKLLVVAIWYWVCIILVAGKWMGVASYTIVALWSQRSECTELQRNLSTKCQSFVPRWVICSWLLVIFFFLSNLAKDICLCV